MDLITQLPKTKDGHDAIVVFVDRLSKMVHFQPTVTTASAPDIAKIFFNTIFRLLACLLLLSLIEIQDLQAYSGKLFSSAWVLS